MRKSVKLDEAQASARSCAGRPDFLPCRDGAQSACTTHSHGKCFKLHWCCLLGWCHCEYPLSVCISLVISLSLYISRSPPFSLSLSLCLSIPLSLSHRWKTSNVHPCNTLVSCTCTLISFTTLVSWTTLVSLFQALLLFSYSMVFPVVLRQRGLSHVFRSSLQLWHTSALLF